MHCSPGKLRSCCDRCAARDLQFEPRSCRSAIFPIIFEYGLAECTGNRYSGHVFESLFMKYGVRYNFAEQSKSELYSGALPLLNSSRVELPDNKKMVEQFCLLERRVPRGSNKESIDHPQLSGAHDDLANACAGAITLASKNLAVLQWAEGMVKARRSNHAGLFWLSRLLLSVFVWS